ncbi:MAG: VOC family protein [Actinomycetota bacterium]
MSASAAPVAQIAYFVTDIRRSAAAMVESLGAGPFHVIDRIELSSCVHRGRPADFVHSSAYGQWGSVMVEFVQQDSAGPSPFRDMYAPGEEGIHHVATIVPDLHAAIADHADHGRELASIQTTTTGTEFAFVDATADLGHMIELYEPSDGLLGFYAMIRAAAEGWDGVDPVRTLR